jgi:hypothetical protein
MPINKKVDLGEELADDTWAEKPGVENWDAGPKGYSISSKLGMLADYIGDSLHWIAVDLVPAAMANVHDYAVFYHPQYLDQGLDAWGFVHRYPRFWTADPVSTTLMLAGRRMPLMYPYRLTDEEIRSRFERDRDVWLAKSATMSSIVDMAMLPEYQRIIGLGAAVVPLIIEELRTEADHWFWALVSVVGEDHGTGAETISEAAERWVTWFDSLSIDE